MISLFDRRSANTYRLPCGRYADPLAAYKVLAAGGINKLLDDRESPDPKKYAAADTAACELVRRAFGLKPLDGKTGRGYADQDCLDVLESFLAFVEKKGGRGKPTPTSTRPTASPATTSPPTNGCDYC